MALVPDGEAAACKAVFRGFDSRQRLFEARMVSGDANPIIE